MYRTDIGNEYFEGNYKDMIDKIFQIIKNENNNLNHKPIIDLNSSDAEECDELPELKIKGQVYLLDGDKLYGKNNNGTKSELYGTYSNGKVKKVSFVKPKEIDV